MYFTFISSTMLVHRQCNLPVRSSKAVFHSFKTYDPDCHFRQTNWVQKRYLDLFSYQDFFFVFFQACDSIILGKYPAPDTTLYLLAALRLQFNEGDYKPGAWV